MSDSTRADSLMPEFGEYSLDSILSEYSSPNRAPAPTIPIDPAADGDAADAVATLARQMVLNAWDDALRMQQGQPVRPAGPNPSRPAVQAAPQPYSAAEVTEDYNRFRRDKHNRIELSTPPIDFMKDTPEDELPSFDPMADVMASTRTGSRHARQHTKLSTTLGLDDIMPAPEPISDFDDIRRLANTAQPAPADEPVPEFEPPVRTKKKRARKQKPVPEIRQAELSAPAPQRPQPKPAADKPVTRTKPAPGQKAPKRPPVKDARTLLLEELRNSGRAETPSAEPAPKPAEISRPAAKNAALSDAESSGPARPAAAPKPLFRKRSAAKDRKAAVSALDPPPAKAPSGVRSNAPEARPKTPEVRSKAPAKKYPPTTKKTSPAPETKRTAPAARKPDPVPRVVPIHTSDTVHAAADEQKDILSGSILSPVFRSIGDMIGRLKHPDEASSKDDTDAGSEAPEVTPDPPVEKAAKYYSGQMKQLKLRTRIATLLWIILAWISLNMPMAGMLGANTAVQASVCLILTLAVCMCTLDIVTAGLRQLKALRPGPEALAVLATLFSCMDAVVVISGKIDTLPYCVIGAVSLTMALWGERMRCTALYRTFRTAAAAKSPSVITVESDEQLGINMLLHTERTPDGLVHQSERGDFAHNVFSSAAPFFLAASLLFSIISSAHNGFEYFLHSLSAMIAAATSFSAFISFSLPYSLTAAKLQPSGSAIAGYAGCRDIGKVRRVVVKDEDLFPPGTMRFAEINIQSGVFVSRVIACTSCMIEQAGCGVAQLFSELMERRGYEPVTVSGLQCHQGGGLSAKLGDEAVLVGSVGFMNLNSIRLPQGIDPKYSICTAMDGELVAVFTIDYIPVTSVQDALAAQLHSKVQAVFAIRDFNISPLMIRQLFKFDSVNFNFPSFLDRDRLAGKKASEDAPVCAVLVRSGLLPVMDVAEYGRRLYTTTRINTIISLIGSIVGLLLMFLLCRAGTFESAAAGNMMLFMLLWTFPVLVLSWSQNR